MNRPPEKCEIALCADPRGLTLVRHEIGEELWLCHRHARYAVKEAGAKIVDDIHGHSTEGGRP